MTAIETRRASCPGHPPMMVHRLKVGTERKTARDLAIWQEPGDFPIAVTSSRSCAARKLARFLVEAGEADGPIEAYGPDGALRYRVNSLYAFAQSTLVENPRLHLTRYVAVSADRFSRTDGSNGSEGMS